MKQETFENMVKPVLLWMGTIVSGVMAVAYIIVVFVLIQGFKVETILNTTIFSIVTALVGFCIMQMLKMQGQAFAADIEENKKIYKQYTRTETKDKKAHSMRYYWITSGLVDVLTKCLTLAITTVGMVYIMIEGSQDYNLLMLAIVNLLMFAGFGLMGLVGAYDFYNESYVPYMLEQINKHENETENKTDLEMAKTEPIEQTDAGLHNSRRTDILESTDNMCSTGSNSESLVVDSSVNNGSVLGRTIHTSSSTLDRTDISIEEINSKTV